MTDYKQKTIYFLSIVMGLILVGLLITPNNPKYGFRINQTNSLPSKLYFSFKFDGSIKRGDIVSFPHSYSNNLVAKEVVGFPGDGIRIIDHHIFINDLDLGEIRNKSPSGKPLHPIQEGVIPEGYYFMHGQHELSFDSRYAEFGLIKIETIQDILWPLF